MKNGLRTEDELLCLRAVAPVPPPVPGWAVAASLFAAENEPNRAGDAEDAFADLLPCPWNSPVKMVILAAEQGHPYPV